MKTIFKKDQLLSPMEKPIIFAFLYLEESILSILGKIFVQTNSSSWITSLFHSKLTYHITIRFDSCYLTISKSHFSVQQIRNYLFNLKRAIIRPKKKSIHLFPYFKLNFLPNLESNCNKDSHKHQFYWPLKDEINEHRDRFFSRNWI